MDNSSQAQVLERVLQLETKKQNLEQSISSIDSSIQGVLSQKPPAPPVLRNVIKEKVPKIKSTVKFNYLLAFLPFVVALVLRRVLMIFLWEHSFLFLPFLGFIWIFIYTLIIYRKEKQKKVEAIRNSPDYTAQCNAIEERFQQQKYAAEFEYAQAKQIYDTQTLPAFEQKKTVAVAELEAKKQAVLSELTEITQELKELYAELTLIPEHFRKISGLTFIYNTMISSDVDLATAVELYKDERAEILYQHIHQALDQQREYQYQQELRESEYAYERYNQSGNEFFSNMASTAAGSYIGNRAANRGERKEMQKQTAYLKKQTEIAEHEAKKRERAEDERKRREAHESQRRWDAVNKENEKRRRNGQPELPLPPRWYY